MEKFRINFKLGFFSNRIMNNTVKIGIAVGAGIVISLVILVFSDPITIEPLEQEKLIFW